MTALGAAPLSSACKCKSCGAGLWWISGRRWWTHGRPGEPGFDQGDGEDCEPGAPIPPHCSTCRRTPKATPAGRTWQGYELRFDSRNVEAEIIRGRELAHVRRSLSLSVDVAAAAVHLTSHELLMLEVGGYTFPSALAWEHLGRMLRDAAVDASHVDCAECAAQKPRTVAPKVARRREPTGRAAQRAAAPPELGPLFERKVRS